MCDGIDYLRSCCFLSDLVIACDIFLDFLGASELVLFGICWSLAVSLFP